MKVDLNGRVAIVTGGGGAIGSAMCEQLAANGAKVVVAGRTLRTLEATVNAVREAGGEATAVTADVSNKESAENLIREAVRIYGKIDCMINNAGINGGPDDRKRVYEYSDELWDRIVSVDLNGVYYCSKYAIRQMILRLQCAFTAAKAGVFNLTKTMALECAPHGIRVNGIAPGSIMFEGTRKLFYADPVKAEGIMSHIPQHQPGEPNDIAWATCFLASDEAKYMTGSVMTIDGGWICGYNREL